MATLEVPTDAEILERILVSCAEPLTLAKAKVFMSLRFDRPTTVYISKLLARNSRGTITIEERIALDGYVRIAQLADLLHASPSARR